MSAEILFSCGVGILPALYPRIRVTPAPQEYIFIIGMLPCPTYWEVVKFMSLYGLSLDTAVALVIAHRVVGHSERCPANYARFGQRKRSNLWPPSSEGGWGLAQKKRHMWSA
jgi:hypothetical protein